MRISQIDLDTLEEKNGHTDAALRSIRSVFSKYGGECLEAARDPLFARIITVPTSFDLEAAATGAADSLLKDGGLASWQTPAIQARGDLMMAAGTCRSHSARLAQMQFSKNNLTPPMSASATSTSTLLMKGWRIQASTSMRLNVSG
jgi:hypothetical protein